MLSTYSACRLQAEHATYELSMTSANHYNYKLYSTVLALELPKTADVGRTLSMSL